MTYSNSNNNNNNHESITLNLTVINLLSFCVVAVFFLPSFCVVYKATNLDNNEMAPIHIAGLRKALRQILENTMNTNVKVQINQALHAIKQAAAEAETARRRSSSNRQ